MELKSKWYLKYSRNIVYLFIAISSLDAQTLGPMLSTINTIALDASGTVYTWGYGFYGQLGNGGTSDSATPVKVLKGDYPGDTYLGDGDNNKVIAVAMGHHQCVALTADGMVYTWGQNDHGQLGDNTTTNRSSPVKVLMGEYPGTTYLGDDSNNKIIAVVMGRYHSAALASDGFVYTWGSNGDYQLGDNTTTDRHTPVKVLKGAYSGTAYLGDNASNKITGITLGSYCGHALASDGTVYSWGYNGYSQLGDGTTTDSGVAVKVLKGDYTGTTYLGDDASNKITKIVGGYKHIVVQAEDGLLYSWGTNFDGELGDGTTTDRNTPVRVKMGDYAGTTYLGDDSENQIVDVAVGEYYSGVVAEDGLVYMWGLNSQYRLGDGTDTRRVTPVKVLKGAYSGSTYLGDDPSNKITNISLGQDHTHALATDNSVFSWGSNTYGELGDGTTTTRSTAVQVVGEGGTGDLSLPVELSSFTCSSNNGSVTLSWITYSEIENNGFNIERKQHDSKLVEWHKISDYTTNPILKGQGSSTQKTYYTFSDKQVQAGITYDYRLSDVDYQGNIKHHQVVSVTVKTAISILNPTSLRINSIYPNPFNPNTNLSYTLDQDMKISIIILDLQGHEIRNFCNALQKAGEHSLSWDGLDNNGTHVSSGIYFYNIHGIGVNKAIKMIKLN